MAACNLILSAPQPDTIVHACLPGLGRLTCKLSRRRPGLADLYQLTAASRFMSHATPADFLAHAGLPDIESVGLRCFAAIKRSFTITSRLGPVKWSFKPSPCRPAGHREAEPQAGEAQDWAGGPVPAVQGVFQAAHDRGGHQGARGPPLRASLLQVRGSSICEALDIAKLQGVQAFQS